MKSLRAQIFLPFLLTIVAAGCAKKDPAPSDTNSIPAHGLLDAEKLAGVSQVHCTNSTQCSPSVGMLVGTTDTEVYQCTAFLVADDIVATNSHCVPDDLKTPGASCKGRIALLFPDMDNYSEAKAGCSQVISASHIDKRKNKPDYAFLKLDQTLQRPALKLTRKGFKTNETYQIVKVDPYQGNGIPEGYMHETTCKVISESLFSNTSESPQAPIKPVADCTIIHGNSGSPILNAKGEAPGIAFATANQDALYELVSSTSSQGLALLDSEIAPMGLVTNYSCLSLPTADAGSAPAECRSLEAPASIDQQFQAVSKRVESDLDERLDQWKSRLDPSLNWKLKPISGKGIDSIGLLTSDKSSTIALAVPQCIQDQKAFQAFVNANAQTGSQDSGDLEATIPAWTLSIGWNRYLQLDYRISEAPLNLEDHMILHLDPAELSSNGESHFTEADALDLQNGNSFYSGVLKACR